MAGGLARLLTKNALAALERRSFCLIHVHKITPQKCGGNPITFGKIFFLRTPARI